MGAQRLLVVPTILALTCWLQVRAFVATTTTQSSRPDVLARRRNTLATTANDNEHEPVVAVPPTKERTTTRTPLPPVIQQIADERKEFQLNLGRAMDTLRRDMPDILRNKPDFSIYHDNIKAFIKFWFAVDRSRLQYRMVYDFCRSEIRISWNAVLQPKFVLMGRPLHVDGISYYQLDSASGKITQHKLENLLINNTPVAPPYGVFSLLQQDVLATGGGRGGVPVPAGVGGLVGTFQ